MHRNHESFMLLGTCLNRVHLMKQTICKKQCGLHEIHDMHKTMFACRGKRRRPYQTRPKPPSKSKSAQMPPASFPLHPKILPAMRRAAAPQRDFQHANVRSSPKSAWPIGRRPLRPGPTVGGFRTTRSGWQLLEQSTRGKESLPHNAEGQLSNKLHPILHEVKPAHGWPKSGRIRPRSSPSQRWLESANVGRRRPMLPEGAQEQFIASDVNSEPT